LTVTRTVQVVDVMAPVISLLGANPLVVSVGDAYVEPGATYTDDVDGGPFPVVDIDASAVNTLVPGVYVVTYDVSDLAGNAAVTVTRTVNVVGQPLVVENVEVELNGLVATVSWDAAVNASTYWVQQSTNGGTTWAYWPSTSNTEVTRTLVAGQSYIFRVVAVSAGGTWGPWSVPSGSVAPLLTENVTVELNGLSATVSWDAADGASTYWVQQSTNGGTTWSYWPSTSNTEVTRTLVAGQSYVFRVVAVTSSNQWGPWSAVSAGVAPLVTENVTVELDGLVATVSWDAADGASTYWVQQSTNGGTSWAYWPSTSNTEVTRTLVAGQSYIFRVVAVTAGGNWGPWSTPTTPPVVPA
jgi:hypothetical protein